ncbi:MAG TPA: S-methyl-5-thioribose-1-phosphate isomerase [Acidimicrobiales bacterium]|nr:S-methyl-5-thioribose-1-phosphate isomerase [Acidimicrobiales bacterium]
MTSEPIPSTIEWTGTKVRMLDQRLLPERVSFVEATTVEELCEAISALVVRGAPALAVAGAMGIALAAARGEDRGCAADRILATRPTAVNLRWGVERALGAQDPAAEAQAMATQDVERNRRLGATGAPLLPPRARVLTHCNTGSLACAGYGTALGVIRAAHEAGAHPVVWVTETRPLLQGSRLTAWELMRLGIPATVIADSAAASVMARGDVDCVVVGADRIAANGDVANKVGTYSLAVLARQHRVPFYVAAPVSTIDLRCPSGSKIEVEHRSADEIALLGDRRVVPEGVPIANPAFDVTPSRLVSAIVTEEGVLRAPYRSALRRVSR